MPNSMIRWRFWIANPSAKSERLWRLRDHGSKCRARRRRIHLGDLVNERWLSTPPDVLAGRFVTEAFEARGLKSPRPAVATSSTYVRGKLASRGEYIAVLPSSMLILDAKRYGPGAFPSGYQTSRRQLPS
jgi:DNA-binding transcriptional LysR family regulator